MDLWQLKIFCKVIELKSFSKAGKSIHLSQPTISSHIKDLESYFNCRLIDRLGKEAVPTSAGSLLYSKAKEILALKESAEASMAEFQGSIKGRLKIGGSTIPGGYILPKFVGKFLSQNKDVKITLIINDTSQIIEQIIDGELELAIVGAKSSDKRIEQLPLIKDNMCVIVPKDHKWFLKNEIELKELKKEPFIIREDGSGTKKSFINRLKEQNILIEDFNIIAELGSTSAIIQGIKNKIGVSILSPIAVYEELSQNQLKALPVKGIDLSRNFYITTSKDRTPSPLMTAFKNFLTTTNDF
ncbi:MAG: selenium metabolism-associated LysR family transcriptional regulator [Desulforegulaceae bacterium]|nr:selenium metabolism-associated LysR family transcriptional regulator [Desulforegulaceae bacterium]